MLGYIITQMLLLTLDMKNNITTFFPPGQCYATGNLFWIVVGDEKTPANWYGVAGNYT